MVSLMRLSPSLLLPACGALICLSLSSCAIDPEEQRLSSYVAFTEREDYPKTSKHWRDPILLEETHAENSQLVIDLGKQRGFLFNVGRLVIDYPICSGRKTHPTPTGTFEILEMKEEKSSNRYGRTYDAEGNLVNGDADIRTDEVPEGGKFVGAPMPYWIRLNNDGIGHHVGPTKRYRASHGCIRGPSNVVPLVFARLKKGNEVVVE